MEQINILVVDDKPSTIKEILDKFKMDFQERNVDVNFTSVKNSRQALRCLERDGTFDLVLLDIRGVNYRKVILDAQSLYPYLPIITISEHRVLSGIMKGSNLGAQGFLFKRDLTTDLEHYTHQKAASEAQAWRGAVDKIHNLIKRYGPQKRHLESSLEIGLIRKKGDKRSGIGEQIAFLKYVRNKPSIAPLFPTVLSSGPLGKGYTYYDMPYFRMKPLRQRIFEEDDQQRCLEVSKRALEHVLEVVFGRLCKQNVNKKVHPEFVKDTYFKKYKLRLSEAENLLNELGRTCGGPSIGAYQKLLKTEQIEINGKTLRNPTAVLGDLERDSTLIKRLQPPFLCMIHGDLHFDNILIDDRLPLKMRIKLIDPRGFQYRDYPAGSGDVAYDIGKLLHSANGHYDFIHAGYLITDVGKYTYRRPNKITMPALKLEEWATVPETRGGSGMIMTSHMQVVKPWARDIFDNLAEYIRTWIVQSKYLRKDKTWWLRAKLNEAMHFCTMGKFHIQKNVQRALAIQVRGIELINEFFEDYKKGAFDGCEDSPD